MKVASFRDVMAGHMTAEIVCLYKGEVMRTLTVNGDMVHMACPNGDEVDVPLDTPVSYEPWFMDRGNMLFEGLGTRLKLCTEADKVRYPDGSMDSVMPSESAEVMAKVGSENGPEPYVCDPLYGKRMDSADCGEN